jgi:hypothetical protein
MRRILLLLVSPLLLAGACAQEPVIADPWHIGIDLPASYEPDAVALRVDSLGGFPLPPPFPLTSLPPVTVYGDGRVVTEGPVIAIYPGPALPNVLVRTISDQAIRQLALLALEAGVGSQPDLGYTMLMDANTTVFTVLTAGGELRTSVYALGDETGSLTGDQIQARRRLDRLRDQLLDLPTTLGTSALGDETPYEPEALAVLTRPWSDPEKPAQPELAWPGPALVGEPRGAAPDAVTCVDVTGADVRAVLDAAAAANQLTPWVSDDRRYHVWFRPLLPEESTCDDL